MPTITAIEDAILSTLQADTTLAGYVRVFTPVHTLEVDELKKYFINPPAMGTILLNGEYDYKMSNVQGVTALFAVLAFNRNLRSLTAAIRGGAPGEKGLWDMIEDGRRVLLGGLSGVDVIDCLPLRHDLLYAGDGIAVASLEVEIKWRNV